jgi:hypothetical protein
MLLLCRRGSSGRWSGEGSGLSGSSTVQGIPTPIPDKQVQHIVGLGRVSSNIQSIGYCLVVVDQSSAGVEESLSLRRRIRWQRRLDLKAQLADGRGDGHGIREGVFVCAAFDGARWKLDAERDLLGGTGRRCHVL